MAPTVQLLVTLEVAGYPDLHDQQNLSLIEEFKREFTEISISLGRASMHVLSIERIDRQ